MSVTTARTLSRRSIVLGLSLIVLTAACTSAGTAGPASPSAPPASQRTPAPTSASGSPPPSASVSAGPHWTYVALGDSSGYGAADCGGCVPYPVGLAARISADTGVAVELHNLTQHDLLTSSILLQELLANATIGTDPGMPRDPGEMASSAATPEPVRDAVAKADIITIQVGGNDIFETLGGAPPYGCGGVFDATCVKSTVDPIEANLESILA